MSKKDVLSALIFCLSFSLPFALSGASGGLCGPSGALFGRSEDSPVPFGDGESRSDGSDEESGRAAKPSGDVSDAREDASDGSSGVSGASFERSEALSGLFGDDKSQSDGYGEKSECWEVDAGGEDSLFGASEGAPGLSGALPERSEASSARPDSGRKPPVGGSKPRRKRQSSAGEGGRGGEAAAATATETAEAPEDGGGSPLVGDEGAGEDSDGDNDRGGGAEPATETAEAPEDGGRSPFAGGDTASVREERADDDDRARAEMWSAVIERGRKIFSDLGITFSPMDEKSARLSVAKGSFAERKLKVKSGVIFFDRIILNVDSKCRISYGVINGTEIEATLDIFLYEVGQARDSVGVLEYPKEGKSFIVDL